MAKDVVNLIVKMMMQTVCFLIILFCFAILVVTMKVVQKWDEFKAQRKLKGGGLVLRNWYREPYGSIPDDDSTT